MRYASGGFEGREDQVLLILGDGARDEKVVSYVAPRFNGTKCSITSIRLPSPDMPRKTGLNALESLILLLDKFKVKRALFLIDKEHVPSIDDVKDWLIGHGCSVEERMKTSEALILNLTRGAKETVLYVAIAGREKRIEEDIESLAQQIYGQAAPKQAHRKIKKLIEKASISQISKAFKGLSTVLKALERECSI